MTCVSSLTEENKNYYKITTDLQAKSYISAEMSSKKGDDRVMFTAKRK